MNRHQRRAVASEQRKAKERRDRLALAYDTLSSLAATDETISGATLILPDGEVLHLGAAAASAGGTA